MGEPRDMLAQDKLIKDVLAAISTTKAIVKAPDGYPDGSLAQAEAKRACRFHPRVRTTWLAA